MEDGKGTQEVRKTQKFLCLLCLLCSCPLFAQDGATRADWPHYGGSDGSPWRHASVIAPYTDAELEPILDFLKAALTAR
jgi:hypothetical protein